MSQFQALFSSTADPSLHPVFLSFSFNLLELWWIEHYYQFGHARPAHELYLNPLLCYCSVNVPSFPSSNFCISQVVHHLPPNSSYLISVSVLLLIDFVPPLSFCRLVPTSTTYVLRKEPSKMLLHSPHAVEREFKVLISFLFDHKCFCCCFNKE